MAAKMMGDNDTAATAAGGAAPAPRAGAPRPEPSTERLAGWLCGAFFALMLANYMLQSVRDAQLAFVGRALGPKLLVASTALSFVAGPLAKRLAKPSATATAAALLKCYRAFAALLLAGLAVDLEGAAAVSTVALTSALYVVSQTANNLVISLLWSFASDLLPRASSMRYYSMFGAACTMGQAAGSLLASTLLWLGLPVHLVALGIAIALEATGRCVVMATMYFPPARVTSAARVPVAAGVGPLAGLAHLVAEPYAALITVYTLCYTATLSLVYLGRMGAVADAGMPTSEAAALSANLSFVASLATFAIQMLLTQSWAATLLTREVGLLTLPAITLLGFACLSAGHGSRLSVLLAFELLRRVAAFAVAKPVRESLYAVLPREQKFALKSIVDTVVYKSGLGAGALVFERVDGSPAAAMVYVGLCGAWVASALGLLHLWRAKIVVGDAKIA